MPSALVFVNALLALRVFELQYSMYLTQLCRRQHEFRNS